MRNPFTESSGDNPLFLGDVFAVAEVKLEQLLSRVNSLDGSVFSSTSPIMVETRAILEHLLEGAVMVDTTGSIRSANRAFCALVDKQEADLIGHSHWEVLGPAASIAALSVLDAGRCGHVHPRCEALLTNPSGKSFPVQITAAALQNGQGDLLGSILFLYDMTRIKELEAAYAKLKASSHLKDILLQLIVHDLRTPLTSLLTGLETAPFVSDLNEAGTKCVEIAIRGGQTLLSMINDLLDISKMEEDALHLDKESLHVPSLIEQAFGQVIPLSQSKNLLLVKDIPYDLPMICADEEKLLRTLVNLMGNAIRFTPEGGAIHVSARVVDADDSSKNSAMMVFAVKDSGMGISPEALPHIFEKFFGVAPGFGKEKVCTGLGLTFCKMAIEAHGGQIWVESESGSGSTFSFSVPLGPASKDKRDTPACPVASI